MKNVTTILFFTIAFVFIVKNQLFAQKNSGIFYSTLYAKEYDIKRLSDFGTDAKEVFLKDINGDSMDDAIAIQTDGSVWVALSDGKFFQNPRKLLTFNYQSGFVQPLLGDLNGDKRNDLLYFDRAIGVVYVCRAGKSEFEKALKYTIGNFTGRCITGMVSDLNGDGNEDLIWAAGDKDQKVSWYSSLSLGGDFAPAIQINEDLGNICSQLMTGDLNGDGKSDIAAWDPQTGNCSVALSDGKTCIGKKDWVSGFYPDLDIENDLKSRIFLKDMDGDKKDDLIIWCREDKGVIRKSMVHDCDWRISWSTGGHFEGDDLWVKNFLSKEHKNNLPDPDFGLVGHISTGQPAAMVVTQGQWLAIEYAGKGTTLSTATIDTYEAWGNDYIPVGGTYDSGDSLIHDQQIRMIHDAGFTYVTMDITNGSNEWVDSRARNFMDRVRRWNQKIKPGQHKMFINISLGRTREVKGVDAFFTKLNLECKRAWEEFYLPYRDLYYSLHNKPMVIHMINTGWDYVGQIETWKGDRSFIDKFTNRWMDGIQSGADQDKPNAYGWIVPGINTFDKEMMPLMPGFWNGLTWYDRKEGETYRIQWLRVFQSQPASVWVNSFNETWEHTSVEPAYQVIDQFVANPLFTKPWTDYYGNRMDDFYWVMTRQYNRLFMDNVLFEGSYFQESGEDILWKVDEAGFKSQTTLPVMAPVLLLPKGFRENFNGKIIQHQ